MVLDTKLMAYWCPISSRRAGSSAPKQTGWISSGMSQGSLRLHQEDTFRFSIRAKAGLKSRRRETAGPRLLRGVEDGGGSLEGKSEPRLFAPQSKSRFRKYKV